LSSEGSSRGVIQENELSGTVLKQRLGTTVGQKGINFIYPLNSLWVRL